jgi:hypothetical protein
VRKVGALFCVLALPSMLFAEAGRNAGTLLTRTMGARANGLGQAMTADSGDIDDIFFNPAGFARAAYPVISATYQNGLLDDNVGGINYGYATNFGGWFVGASALDAGKIDLNQSDGTRGSLNAERDFSTTLGLALGKHGPFSIGASVKYLRSQLAQTATASSVAGDAGIYWETPVPGLQLAASVQNVGSDLQYEVDKEPLPTAERVGASYLLDLEESLKTPGFLKCRYLLLLDGVKTKNDDAAVNAGLEIRKPIDTPSFPGWGALRGGYVGADNAFAVGVGFNIWNVAFDYAITLINSDNTQRATLGYRFAPKPHLR